MSAPAYSVTFRPEINLVDATMHAVLTLSQAKTHMDERAAGYGKHRFRPGHLMRIKLGGNPAQSHDVVAYMEERVRDFPVPGRIAVASAIARMQARRAVYSVDGNRRMFEDASAALTWLLDRKVA